LLGQKIEVSNTALSDANETTSMLFSENIDNGHSSTSRINNSMPKIRDCDLPVEFLKTQIQTQTVDNFVEKRGLVPNLIKIDIEGAEHLFLSGGTETIKKYKPVLYIELHSEYCALRCTQQLLKMGYEIDVLKQEDDNRLLVKAFYYKSQDAVSEFNAVFARQNFKIDNITKQISDIERQMIRQNQVVNTIHDKQIKIIEDVKQQIIETIKSTGIYGLLRRIKRKFIK
jgi:FkbM family methyltransferase